MACARKRMDDCLCGYLMNAVICIGPGRNWLNRTCRHRLKAIAREEVDFHCGIDVFSLRVDAHGFTLVCAAQADVPEEADIRAAWHRRHAGTAREREIDRPGAVTRAGERMRDISSLGGTIKQRFMQWYNAEHGTSGSIWAGRFRSIILNVVSGVRSVLRRFRRELFPVVTRNDPEWKEAIDLACRALGTFLNMMSGTGILRWL